MLENHKDKEATKAAGFQDKRSWISIAGHQYLRGKDRSALRHAVFDFFKGKCCICGRATGEDNGDMEHEVGGRPLARCDCFHTRLANGVHHTNVRWICGMFGLSPCHRKKHNREPQLKWLKS